MLTRINIYPRGAVRECVSGRSDCEKTPSEYASSGYIVWGAEMRSTYLRNPNRCYLLCYPVPCQVDGTPVLCISASAASPYARVCSVFSDLCFYLYDYCYCCCPSISAFPRFSCVVLAPPAGHTVEVIVWFFELCVAALFFFLFLPSFWSYRAVLLLVHHLDIS